MDRAAFFVTLVHHPQALLTYNVIWCALMAAAAPFALRLRRAAQDIDRRIRWERACSR